jgi:hypothetical protein
VRHWIQSVKERWKTTSPKVEEKTYDYTPSKDFYKRVREKEAKEKKRKEKWSKELKQSMNTNNYTYNSAYTVSNPNVGLGTISTTTRLGDSKVTIDGGANGSMRVDVPLLVNGRDIMKEIDEMRDAMLLLKRDVDMEAKYPRLKEIKDEYERALEKYTTFDALKESK